VSAGIPIIDPPFVPMTVPRNTSFKAELVEMFKRPDVSGSDSVWLASRLARDQVVG
jgi:hypothetical protein